MEASFMLQNSCNSCANIIISIFIVWVGYPKLLKMCKVTLEDFELQYSFEKLFLYFCMAFQ